MVSLKAFLHKKLTNHTYPAPTFDGHSLFSMNCFDKLNAITTKFQSSSAIMIMFCVKQEDKSSMAGITHKIRFHVLGVVLLADSTNDWANSNEDDGYVQHFRVESEMESDSTEDNSVLM